MCALPQPWARLRTQGTTDLLPFNERITVLHNHNFTYEITVNKFKKKYSNQCCGSRSGSKGSSSFCRIRIHIFSIDPDPDPNTYQNLAHFTTSPLLPHPSSFNPSTLLPHTSSVFPPPSTLLTHLSVLIPHLFSLISHPHTTYVSPPSFSPLLPHLTSLPLTPPLLILISTPQGWAYVLFKRMQRSCVLLRSL